MTRQKKTRSLKRIHNVKTGNKSKLKKLAPDRQGSKKIKNRTKSVFEKFLDENPQAKDQLKQQEQARPVVETEVKDTPKKVEKDSNPKERSLLDQLESKDFKDIY